MAIKKVDRNERLNFVSLHDDAINKEAMSEVELAQFKLTRDMGLLKYYEGKEPTIFVLRPNLSLRGSAKVQNNSIDLSGAKDAGGAKVLLGNMAIDSLKEILVDIINPKSMKKGDGIEFKQGGDGLILDSCLEEIPNLIRVEISTFYLALQQRSNGSADIKKN